MIKVDIKGVKSLEASLKRLNIDVEKVTRNAVKESALKIEADAKRLIQRGFRSGAVYGSHIASAPGEAPKTDTGNLVRHITSSFSNKGFSADVGSREQAKYGLYLEFGTSLISPRPWLRPTLEKNKKFIENAFARNLQQVIRGINGG